MTRDTIKTFLLGMFAGYGLSVTIFFGVFQ
jgi:hypothetical protein